MVSTFQLTRSTKLRLTHQMDTDKYIDRDGHGDRKSWKGVRGIDFQPGKT
jgi:hypothetical protein